MIVSEDSSGFGLLVRQNLINLPLLWAIAELLATNISADESQELINSPNILSEFRCSASVGSLIVYRPQADPLVLGSSSKQSLFRVLVVREGHTLHHVSVVLKHSQRSKLLPPEYPDPMVPAR